MFILNHATLYFVCLCLEGKQHVLFDYLNCISFCACVCVCVYLVQDSDLDFCSIIIFCLIFLFFTWSNVNLILSSVIQKDYFRGVWRTLVDILGLEDCNLFSHDSVSFFLSYLYLYVFICILWPLCSFFFHVECLLCTFFIVS